MPWHPGDPAVYLDGDVTLGGHARAAGQSVELSDPVLVGDVAALDGHAAGGADTLRSSTSPEVALIGDAGTVGGHALGGDDLLLLGNQSTAGTFGDAVELGDHAEGGNDSILGSGLIGVVHGDAAVMSGHARGGDDLIDLAIRSVAVFGDAELLQDFARGGNDTISISGALGTTAYGDGGLADHARGGDDLIDVFSSLDFGTIAGDGPFLRDHARGGDDTLLGALGGTLFWGDAPEIGAEAQRGRDLFVVRTYGGPDTIGDFVPGEDRIEFRTLGQAYHSLDDVPMSHTDDGLVLTFENGKTLTLPGVSELSASDVIFA